MRLERILQNFLTRNIRFIERTLTYTGPFKIFFGPYMVFRIVVENISLKEVFERFTVHRKSGIVEGHSFVEGHLPIEGILPIKTHLVILQDIWVNSLL